MFFIIIDEFLFFHLKFRSTNLAKYRAHSAPDGVGYLFSQRWNQWEQIEERKLEF